MWSIDVPGATPSFTVTSFSPGSTQAPGDAAKTLTFKVSGTSFPASAVVWLYRGNQPVIKATGVTVVTTAGVSTATCTLDVSGWVCRGGKQSHFKVVVADTGFTTAGQAPGDFDLTP